MAKPKKTSLTQKSELEVCSEYDHQVADSILLRDLEDASESPEVKTAHFRFLDVSTVSAGWRGHCCTPWTMMLVYLRLNANPNSLHAWNSLSTRLLELSVSVGDVSIIISKQEFPNQDLSDPGLGTKLSNVQKSPPVFRYLQTFQRVSKGILQEKG